MSAHRAPCHRRTRRSASRAGGANPPLHQGSRTMKKITVRKTGSIKLTSPASYILTVC
ncbi:hypothetical protein ATKI12_5091 [Kitasatospora sp. Ki12]